MFLGAGGGGGGGGTNGPGTQISGGAGGGIIVITAGTMTILGSIQSNGVGGSTNSNTEVAGNCVRRRGSGEGGGGAGGTIRLSATSFRVRNASLLTEEMPNPNIIAEGRTNVCRLGGGIGGLGRIRLDYISIQGVFVDGTPADDFAFSEGTEEARDLTKNRTNPHPLVVGGF